MGTLEYTKVPKAIWVKVPGIYEDAKYFKKEK